MILGVHHVAISTPKTAALAALLAKALPLLRFPALEGGALFAAPNLYLLAQETAVSGPRRALTPDALGMAHLCLQSPDAAALWEALSADGGVAWTAPLTGLGGPFRYAYGYSSEGLMWELEETLATPEGAPTAWLAHIAFVTRDLRRLAGFYGNLLDRPVTEGPTVSGSRRADRITGLSGASMTPAWVHGLNLGLEFWRFDAPDASVSAANPEGSGFAAVCLQSDDLDADCAAAVRFGATLEDPARPWAGGVQVRLRDPDGNPLHLLRVSEDHPFDLRRLPHGDVLARHALALEAPA